MKNYFLIIFTIFSVFTAQAEEESKSKDRIGPGKAVIAANEKEGFKLSEKAKNNLNITVKEVNSAIVTVPKKSIISFLDFYSAYRLRDGWYRAVEIEPNFEGDKAIFSSNQFKVGDKVVIENSGLLRVVELDVFGPEADACVD
ncbi:hypothetical protein DAY19_08480 [Halobacteriovorax vibrionivorans]|uniref:SH3b domain-containing protein n=1 Tax=Halobacteriovorax vibrionivorans TaxID=2152716 RepID=A0ABY0IFJ7_9BACT|nr:MULTISPECIES: hypothetical protein [Halobacteriovorax]RZF21715.1 hypothetical protein DAY19_08480 [Halobacteriovorax vibrionivorans]TGD46162.1 hypothetical protein EP118_13110 [Halobacteriovorax sp. Y22]